MSKKEQIRTMIDNLGVFDVSKMIGLSVYDLIKYSDYPIDNPTILSEIIQDYFITDVDQRPGGRMYYKEFVITYDRFEGVVVWNDGEYVERNDGEISFVFYATPFWDGMNVIPINLSDVFIYNIEGDELMSIMDEIDEFKYCAYIDVDHKKLDNPDKLILWLRTEYLELTYNEIQKLKFEVINEIELS
jgi:hypothetical protein